MVPKSRDVILFTEWEKRYDKHAFEPSFNQRLKDKISALAQRYGLSRTTVTNWRSRTTTTDAPMGPSQPKRIVLSPAEETAQ